MDSDSNILRARISRLEAKGLPTLHWRFFPQMRLSTVVVPRWDAGKSGQGNGHRTKKAFSRQLSAFSKTTAYFGGAARGHLGPASAPISCLNSDLYACISPSPFPEAFTAPWDRNSTPAGCGCQEGIPIYCSPKQLTPKMLLSQPGFSTGSASCR